MTRSVLLVLLLLLPASTDIEVREHGVFAPSRLLSVKGQDGVSSIPFSEKMYLWTFGDTIIGRGNGTETMLANSLAFTPAPSAGNIRDLEFSYYTEKGRITPFIKNTADEDPSRHRLWALDGIRLGNTVYVYYLHIIVHSKKALDFSLDSVGLARWDIPAGWKVGDPVRFIRRENLFPGSGPAFGASVMRKDGFLYITGQYSDGKGSSPVKIARVPEDRISSAAAYGYLTTDGRWSDKCTDAAGFAGDVAGECSLSYNMHLGGYFLLYCRIFSRDIVMLRFDEFSSLSHAKKAVLLSNMDSNVNNLWYYSGKEIYSEKNSLYMIYINSREYQPHLVEITFGQGNGGI